MTDKCCKKTIRCDKCAKKKRRRNRGKLPTGKKSSGSNVTQISLLFPQTYRPTAKNVSSTSTQTMPPASGSSISTQTSTHQTFSPGRQEVPLADYVDALWNDWVRRNVLSQQPNVEEEVIEFRPEREWSSPEYRTPPPRRQAGGPLDFPSMEHTPRIMTPTPHSRIGSVSPRESQLYQEISPHVETPIRYRGDTPYRMTSPVTAPRRGRVSRQTLRPDNRSLDDEFMEAMK